jgi:2-oxoglutarate dehydrogenase E2 component (dihydrolipoamide succinyltransferase)
MIRVVVPELGLSPSEPITLSSWLVRVGDEVFEGDRLVELLIGEMTFDVASPASGRLVQKKVEPDERVAPGGVLGVIEPAS